MMANIFGLLLITTSNRSEGCTGYWTAGGDGEGGLALISGWPKLLVCMVVDYLRDHGLIGLKPIPELAYVTKLKASAELQPQEMGQNDEDALAPFPVLYEIENHARLLLQSPLQCAVNIQAKLPQYTLRQMGRFVEKWFRLWSRNQWKRDQATSGLQTTEFNVDKRGGTDISIIHSGYREEIGLMWDYINAHEPEPSNH
jgi:NAD+ synthase (glutamine-hydrolysing)